MEKGRIVEQGNHEELLHAHGAYTGCTTPSSRAQRPRSTDPPGGRAGFGRVCRLLRCGSAAATGDVELRVGARGEPRLVRGSTTASDTGAVRRRTVLVASRRRAVRARRRAAHGLRRRRLGALVVTSPPYFAASSTRGARGRRRAGVVPRVPGDAHRRVPECVRTLEPGVDRGQRRQPRPQAVRSLSADVIRILEHDLGLLAARRTDLAEGRGRQRLVRMGIVRSAATRAARHQRAASSLPARAASIVP